MWFFSRFGVLVMPACWALAGAPESVLDYRIKVRLRDESAWVESGFRVITSPPLVTRNKVKKPRMGRWRLEPVSVQGVTPGAALLARAASLLYLAGPSPELAPRDSGMTLGHRYCRLWQAPTPPGVAAYVYLAEVAPNLLALSYLSSSRAEGDLAALEIHLVGAELGSHPSPAEEGTTLLRTLRRWSVAPSPVVTDVETVETEEIR